MNKGMIRKLPPLLALWLPLTLAAQGEIYRVVDKDGNVTFTDQRPSATAQPMDLPPLSVIESDIQVQEPTVEAATSSEPQAPTPRDLRRQYSDFRITQPEQEETFWGTANSVVVGWGTSEPPLPDMSARLYVDETPQDVPAIGNVSLTLDRGEHNVYAELLDARKRVIVTTQPVTFFIHQNSVNFNQRAVSPPNQSGP
jgi:hypothetical protein